MNIYHTTRDRATAALTESGFVYQRTPHSQPLKIVNRGLFILLIGLSVVAIYETIKTTEQAKLQESTLSAEEDDGTVYRIMSVDDEFIQKLQSNEVMKLGVYWGHDRARVDQFMHSVDHKIKRNMKSFCAAKSLIPLPLIGLPFL